MTYQIGRLNHSKTTILFINLIITRSDVISVLGKSKDKLQNQFGVEKLVLLGSFARNQQTEESDIDVFVTMPAKLFGVIAVKQYLEDIIGLKVDLVRNHKRLNESLLNEIQRDGIDIFECKGFCTFDIV